MFAKASSEDVGLTHADFFLRHYATQQGLEIECSNAIPVRHDTPAAELQQKHERQTTLRTFSELTVFHVQTRPTNNTASAFAH
jgi:hypothetical protein